MKFTQTILCFIFILAFDTSSFGQCPEKDVYLTSQFELDLFANKYPNCKELNGNLTIYGGYIYDWESFPEIEYVGGDLWIERISEKEGIEQIIGKIKYVGGNIIVNSEQEELEQGDFLADQEVINGYFGVFNFNLSEWGFSNIHTIKKTLYITQAKGVTNLDVFQNLASVGSLVISRNDDLEDIEALSNMEGALNFIEISDNPKLQFCNLPILCESIAKDSMVTVSNNSPGSCSNIIDFYTNCGFDASICKQLDVILLSQEDVDSFNINYNICQDSIRKLSISGDLISNLDSLYALRTLDELFISANNIENLKGLEGINSIRSLKVQSAERLINLDGLESVENLKYLQLAYCPNLENINSIQFEGKTLESIKFFEMPKLGETNVNCDSIIEKLLLEDVPQSTVDMFEDVSYIQNFEIKRCASVTSVDGILDSTIPSLIEIENCENIEMITIGSANSSIETFSSFGNNNLKTLHGLGDLGKVNYFLINSNPLLENIIFSSISSINYLRIYGNDQLKSIEISQIDTIKTLSIFNNLLLDDISFIENVKAPFGTLDIRNNPILELCNFQVICNFIDTLKHQELLSLGGNGFGCNIENIQCVNTGNIYTNLWIDSQEDMDFIAQQYPSADSVFGQILIQNFDGDLSYFNQIEYTDAAFTLNSSSASLEPFKNCHIMQFNLNNYQGDDLPIFEGLESIRRLSLIGCEKMENLEAFSKVKEVSGQLILKGLTEIETLDDLHDSIHVGSIYLDDLNIKDLKSIQHLKELNTFSIISLNSIGNFYDLNLLSELNELRVETCGNLIDLFVENQFDTINSIRIVRNSKLKSLEGFERITNLSSLTIDDNIAIEKIDFFPMLANENGENGRVRILNNHLATSISFPSLKYLSHLDIIDNETLQVLDFSNDLLITNRLNIGGNESLNVCTFEWICNSLDFTSQVLVEGNGTSCFDYANLLEGCGIESPRCPPSSLILNSLASIENYNEKYSTCRMFPEILTISINLDSTEVKPILDSLRRVKYLRIKGYYNKETFSLPLLEKIDEALDLQGSKYLKEIDLPALKEIREVRISYNQNLTDLDWLPNIEFSVLDIQNNHVLKTVSFDHDFDINNFFRVEANFALEKIGNENWNFDIQKLTISSNESLTDISGLENIKNINSLDLIGNEYLKDCDIEPICKGLETKDFYTILSNGEDCETNEEVSFICENPISTADVLDSRIDVFPNPTHSRIKVDCYSADFLQAEIISMSGQKVLTSNTDEIDVESIKSGMYFLKVTTSLGIKSFKIIKF